MGVRHPILPVLIYAVSPHPGTQPLPAAPRPPAAGLLLGRARPPVIPTRVHNVLIVRHTATRHQHNVLADDCTVLDDTTWAGVNLGQLSNVRVRKPINAPSHVAVNCKSIVCTLLGELWTGGAGLLRVQWPTVRPTLRVQHSTWMWDAWNVFRDICSCTCFKSADTIQPTRLYILGLSSKRSCLCFIWTGIGSF